MLALINLIGNLLFTRMIRACFLLFFIVCTPLCLGADFYIKKPYDQPNSDYEVQLLQIALDHAPGSHRLFYVEVNQTQGRMFRELADGTSPANIIFSGYSREREAITQMIYVPLTRGLLGHRMFLVHQSATSRFQNIDTLEQLTQVASVGVGVTRPSEVILPAAGFQIVRVPGERLIPMLIRRRFTGLLYGLDEINLMLDEVQKKPGGDQIVIEKSVLVSFPFDSFFFVGPTDQIRAEIVTKGLQEAYKTGAFMEHFKKFPPIQTGLNLFQTAQPTVFEIENPDMSPEMKAIPYEYWHHFNDAAD